jgi:hypothetical protein
VLCVAAAMILIGVVCCMVVRDSTRLDSQIEQSGEKCQRQTVVDGGERAEQRE